MGAISARSASSRSANTGSAWTPSTGFVSQEPLWKVHQFVFAVLALESEPVDPRL